MRRVATLYEQMKLARTKQAHAVEKMAVAAAAAAPEPSATFIVAFFSSFATGDTRRGRRGGKLREGVR